MSVSSTTIKAGPFVTTGVIVSYPFTFKVFSAADIRVVLTDLAGTESDLTLTSDYTVALNADQNANPGGSITPTNAYIAGCKITPISNITPNQLVNVTNFRPDVQERALDKLTILVLQLYEKTGRALIGAVSSTTNGSLPSPVANNFLGWNSAANAIVNYAGVASVAVSGFMSGLLQLTTAAAARAYLAITPSNIGAAASGANNDITSLNSPNIQSATCVTQPANDNSTKVASTAYADRAASNKIQPILASVATNALTVTLNPTTLDFRSTTLTTGLPNTRSINAAISLTVPNTATLGTISAQSSRLAILAIDNAGTVECAIVNLAGGIQLDETNLISTTALSTSSTANNVIYSTTARTNVAYRVVGFIDITESTAGTWATAPSLVQGVGGQALAAMSSLGYGQKWVDVTGSRTAGTTYYNTTGKPIFIQTMMAPASNGTISVNGVLVAQVFTATGTNMTYGALVPVGASYVITGFSNFWVEVR